MNVTGLTFREGLGRKLTIEEGDGNIAALRDAIEGLTLEDVLRVLSVASAFTDIIITRKKIVGGVEVDCASIGIGQDNVVLNGSGGQFTLGDTSADINVPFIIPAGTASAHAVNLGQVMTILSGFAALTGATFTGDVQLPSLPVNANSAVTKGWVESVVDSLKWKRHARVASVANVDIASAPAAIDGVTLSVGDRIVLKDQTEGTQNGVYDFNGVGNPLSRSSDSDTGAELANYTIPVESGTVNKDSWWTIINDTVTIGTTVIVFSKTGGVGTYANGTGLNLAGNIFSVDTTWLAGIIATAIAGKANTSDVALKLDASKLTEWALTSYVQSITWTGIAPSGASNASWQATKLGKEVSGVLSFIAASAGSSIQSIIVPLPTGLPDPVPPTGFNGSADYVYPVFATVFSSASSGPSNIVTRGAIRKNGSAWEIAIFFNPSAIAGFQVSFKYYAS